MLKNKVLKNASWIIVCRIAQSLLGLIITMLSARYLGPSNYGVINYASSIVAFVVPIMTLGLNNVLVQEFVNHPEKEGEILGSSLLLSLASSLLCIVGVISFAFVANAGETITIVVCALYSLMLIPQALELSQYWFQSKYLSKYTSVTALVAYTVVSLYKIFLLASKKSIYWFAVSNALDYLLIAVTLIFIYKKLGGQRLSFSKETAFRLFSKSKYYIVSSLMVTVFAQTDKIMIKLMIGDAATGYYSAAVQCAGITSFVFSAIIDSVRPMVLQYANSNRKKYEESLSKAYCVIIYLALLQSIVMTIFAKFIINSLYGVEYSPAIVILQVIVWYTAFSYYGGAKDIWILSENKQRYLLWLNLAGAVVNVLLNLILIPYMGAVGAAVVSLLTQFFTNIIMVIVLKPLRKNNLIFLKALNPMLVVSVIISILKSFGKKEH